MKENATSATLLLDISREISPSDGIGVRVVGSTLTAIYKPVGSVWYEVGSVEDTDYNYSSYIAIGTDEDSEGGVAIDDFGGGNYTAPPASSNTTFSGTRLTNVGLR
jgi:hypothetical protein